MRRRPRAFMAALAALGVGCGALLSVEDAKYLAPADADADADAADGSGSLDAPIDAGPIDGCGPANRDCLGGACVDARCEPVELAGDIQLPNAIAISGTRVFWTTAFGDVFSCDRRNCATSRELVAKAGDGGYSKASPALGVVADDVSVYWGQYYESKIFHCPIDGCDGGIRAIGSGHVPSGMTEDDASVYWIGTGNDRSEIYRCARGDCTAAVLVARPLADLSWAISLWKDRLYYASTVQTGASAVTLEAGVGGFYWVSTSGGAQNYVITGANMDTRPSAITALGTGPEPALYYTYWGPMDDAGQRTQGVVAGMNPSTVEHPWAVMQAEPGPLVVDDTYIYWLNIGDGTVRRCKLTTPCGTSPEVLATDQRFDDEAQMLVQDERAIYWITVADPGKVMMLAK